MLYVIQDIRSGKFVAPPGSERSFTPKLQDARTFLTRESAEREACEVGEVVLSLEQAMNCFFK